MALYTLSRSCLMMVSSSQLREISLQALSTCLMVSLSRLSSCFFI